MGGNGSRKAPAPRWEIPHRAAIALIALALAGGPAAPAAPPDGFEVVYELETQGVTVGETHWSLTPAGGGRYVYESRSRTTGLAALLHDDRITERSEWRYLDAGRVQPVAYRYRRTGKKDRTVTVDFDWERGVASSTVRGRSYQMEVPPGTLDKLSYVLALMQDLAAGRESVRYTIADGGKLKVYRLEVEARETVRTALGELETLRVQRVRDGGERETTIWCAPKLGFLPVRIEHHEDDGTSVAISIRRVEGL